MQPNQILLCEYCIEAIRSRGERLVIIDEYESTYNEQGYGHCDWCAEDEPNTYVCEFR